MRLEKTYRQLEDMEEVHIYDITENELFRPVPQEFEMFYTPFEKTLNELSMIWIFSYLMMTAMISLFTD